MRGHEHGYRSREGLGLIWCRPLFLLPAFTMASKTKMDSTESQGFTDSSRTEGFPVDREFAGIARYQALDSLQSMVTGLQSVSCFFFPKCVDSLLEVFTDSDMVYFTVLGKSFLVLNSLQAVQDLLVKRSDKYSDRPRMPMICEVSVISSFPNFSSVLSEFYLHQDGLQLVYWVHWIWRKMA